MEKNRDHSLAQTRDKNAISAIHAHDNFGFQECSARSHLLYCCSHFIKIKVHEIDER